MVLLPLPLPPRTTVIAPGGNEHDKSRSTWRRPYDIDTPRNSTLGEPPPLPLPREREPRARCSDVAGTALSARARASSVTGAATLKCLTVLDFRVECEA